MFLNSVSHPKNMVTIHKENWTYDNRHIFLLYLSGLMLNEIVYTIQCIVLQCQGLGVAIGFKAYDIDLEFGFYGLVYFVLGQSLGFMIWLRFIVYDFGFNDQGL